MLNKKYKNISFLFFTTIFFSSFIFSYDEEKIVVLCLISFVTILYYNSNQIIFDLLQEQSFNLQKEFYNLFSDKIKIMKKLRSCWRIFLDIEDFIIEIFCWIKNNFNQIIIIRNKKRLQKFWKLIIKKDLNFILQNEYNNNKFLKFITLKLYYQQIIKFYFIKFNIVNYLKNLKDNNNIKQLLLFKLKKNVIIQNISYNTYLYLKWN